MSFERILGLDLSLTSTGYCHNGNSGLIRVKSKQELRLLEISSQIIDICSNLKIDLVSIEGYSFGSIFSRAHSIGELGGVVKLSLFNAKIPFVVIPPTCRAKFATGKGNSKKIDVIEAISQKTNIDFSGAGGDDRCDAWILEEMILTKMGKSNYTWDKENLDAFKKVDWAILGETQ